MRSLVANGAAKRPRSGGRTAASSKKAKGKQRGSGASELPLVELIALAEKAFGSLHDVFEALDSSILHEFSAIAESISRAKEDIGGLQPGDLSQRRIPEAGLELAAVVEATETATHQIMEAAERMLEAGDMEPQDYRTFVEGEVMKIFEACTFQDITGQRVSKVVHALEDIDERVSRIGRALGTQDAPEKTGTREAARKARNRKLILNGPAAAGDGVGQDAVDALFD